MKIIVIEYIVGTFVQKLWKYIDSHYHPLLNFTQV